jgi:hypothetical protein
METSKTRSAIIGKLQKQFNTTGLDFLQNAKVVINHIKTTPTTKGTLPAHSSIKTILANIKATLRDAKLPTPDLYTSEFNKYAQEQQVMTEAQTKTEVQCKNWKDWNSVASLKSKFDLNSRDYLIYALYTMNPPTRLDYTPMKWVGGNRLDKTINYIITHRDGTHTFVINQYKTAKTYGQIKFKATPELDEVLNNWRGMHQSDEFLLMSDREAISPNALGQAITRIFGCSLNILRHAYISHVRDGELSYNEKKELASKMGHSPEMQELYRKI